MTLVKKFLIPILVFLSSTTFVLGQKLMENTTIKGFAHGESTFSLEEKKLSFSIGEQDMFIKSELSDKVSFLGETVFKYSNGFQASVERIIFQYNYKGNHNILAGKRHTASNYWNDTYHHGRVFFPSINRPLFFKAEIFPIHTTGVSLQGQNLGKARIGYDLMLGNGFSSENSNDDNFHSVTMNISSKPFENNDFKIMLAATFDHISTGVMRPSGDGHSHSHTTNDLTTEVINHQSMTASLSYFGSKFEFLSETIVANNTTKEYGTANTLAHYTYLGVIPKGGSIAPYSRFDLISYQSNERFYAPLNKRAFTLGIRYEYTFNCVVKLEYQHLQTAYTPNSNIIQTQIAVGF